MNGNMAASHSFRGFGGGGLVPGGYGQTGGGIVQWGMIPGGYGPRGWGITPPPVNRHV